VALLNADAIARLVIARRFVDPGVAVAIALAESGGRTDAVRNNLGPPPSRDRGLWQINSRFHPDVTDAQAFNAAAATDAAHRLSNGGRSWTLWNAFRNSAYLRYLATARAAVNRQTRPAWWASWVGRPKPTIRAFSRGPEVSYLQSVLALRAAQPVRVTGIFDGATDQAVRNVQRFFHLTVDGVVGSRQTWPVIDLLASH
jgi:hypothetical protein